MRDVVLFDMDGTLTEPRLPMQSDMLASLRELHEVADIGIVSGSTFDYIAEQCGPPTFTSILPCNGTQYYVCVPPHGLTSIPSTWEKRFALDMRAAMGRESYNSLIFRMNDVLRNFWENYPDLPLTGNFISYRGSMVNLCPIGRDAGPDERAAFVAIDANNNARQMLREMLAPRFPDLNMVFGGQTSLDIFPKGWDKTFAMRHFPDRDFWFIGDKCTGTGNDRPIFDALAPKGRAFETTGPEKTKELIRALINTHLEARAEG